MWTGQFGVALQPLADEIRESIFKQTTLHGGESND